MSDTANTPTAALVSATVDVVTAYVAHNAVPASALPGVIASVHAALACLGTSTAPVEARPEHTPAEIRKSVTPDHLVSFEDGKPYKTLKRHLAGCGLTPETYRAKHGLPVDYPMVAAAYAEQRSELAKRMGLGQVRRKGA